MTDPASTAPRARRGPASREGTGLLLVLGACVLWGTSATLARWTMKQDVPALVIVELRLMLSVIVLAAGFALVRPALFRIARGDVGRLLILGTVELFGYPVLGMRSFVTEDFTTAEIVMDRLWHLMLPSIILAIGGLAGLSRYTRSSMLEVVRQDYVRTAKAKGLSEESVYYKHALRNALLPIITIFGFLIPDLIGGSIIMESVFAWPGIGRLSYQAVLARDYPVVMTILSITAVLTLIGNFIADILYGIADPRIRYQ